MDYLLENYLDISNVLDRYVLVSILTNMVRDGKYSAMNFMRIFCNKLIHETIPLIRESCLSEVVYFTGYLKPQD
jgi:hypothetical protein